MLQPSHADDTVVDRTNWGVLFKQVARLYHSDYMWQHTYQVDISDIQSYLISSKMVLPDLCSDNSTVLCTEFYQSVRMIDMFRRDAINMLNSTVSMIYQLIPHKEIQGHLQERSERAFLPFMADISKSLFGTARQKDLVTLQKQIQLLTNQFNDNQAVDENTVEQMTSFMAKANQRMSDLFEGIQSNHALIQTLSSSLQESMKLSSKHMIAMFNTMVSEMALSHKLTNQAENLLSGVQSLIQNKLSPKLITPQLLAKTLKQIEDHLLPKYYALVTLDTTFYYETATVAYQRHHTAIYVSINIPITSHPHTYDVFSVQTFPVLLHETTDHVTQYFPKHDYLAIDIQQQTFIELTTKAYDHCHGQYIKFCSLLSPPRLFNTPSCLLSIFLDIPSDIMDVCDFRFLPHALQSFVQKITDNKYLLSNVTVITRECENRPLTSITGCSLCIVGNMECDCVIQADDFYITHNLRECANTSANMSITYPVNLALLSHFFSSDLLKSISGDTTFSKPTVPAIPTFDIFEHNFSKIIANDKEAHLSLKVMVQQAKKQQKIYKTLSHRIWANFQNIPQSFLVDWSPIAAYVSLGMNLCLLVIIVGLAFKLRKLAIVTAVLLSTPNAAHSLTPPYFDWFTTTTQAPSVATDTPCFEKPSLFLILTCFCLIIIIQLIHRIVKNCSRSRSDRFILQIRTNTDTIFVPIVALPHTLCPWNLQGTSNVASVTLKRCFCKFQLSLDWKDLQLCSANVSTTVTLPTTIKLTCYQHFKLRSIISQTYHVYFFIQTDNFLRMLSPSPPHRSSLYPSLPSQCE